MCRRQEAHGSRSVRFVPQYTLRGLRSLLADRGAARRLNCVAIAASFSPKPLVNPQSKIRPFCTLNQVSTRVRSPVPEPNIVVG